MYIFDIELLKQLLVVIFSIAIGIPAGFAVDRWIKKRDFIKEKKNAIKLFKDSLGNNLNLLKQIENILKNNPTIEAKQIDMIILNKLIVKKYEYLKDTIIIETTETLYLLIVEFNLKINLLTKYHIEAQSKPVFVDKYSELKNEIFSDIITIKSIINKLNKLLNT